MFSLELRSTASWSTKLCIPFIVSSKPRLELLKIEECKFFKDQSVNPANSEQIIKYINKWINQ